MVSTKDGKILLNEGKSAVAAVQEVYMECEKQITAAIAAATATKTEVREKENGSHGGLSPDPAEACPDWLVPGLLDIYKNGWDMES
eukprot:7549425-Karenia_brevis.AAC.1